RPLYHLPSAIYHPSRATRAKGQPETERAKHPAKVLTFTVDVTTGPFQCEHPALRPRLALREELGFQGVPEGSRGFQKVPRGSGFPNPEPSNVEPAGTFENPLEPPGTLKNPGENPLEPQGSNYTRTRMTTRRFWARPSRVSFGAIGFSSP